MSNENCLEGMQCPKCESLEPFVIEITTHVKVWDEGTDITTGHQEWDHNSYCGCPCGFSGKVSDFSEVPGEVAHTS
jgi:hypothetical protein